MDIEQVHSWISEIGLLICTKQQKHSEANGVYKH